MVTMADCAECVAQGVAVPKWKAPFMFIGVLLFCPCHLPITFAFFAGLAGGVVGFSWFFQQKPLVYFLFSVIYIVLLVFFVRWVIRRRGQDVVHETHAQEA